MSARPRQIPFWFWLVVSAAALIALLIFRSRSDHEALLESQVSSTEKSRISRPSTQPLQPTPPLAVQSRETVPVGPQAAFMSAAPEQIKICLYPEPDLRSMASDAVSKTGLTNLVQILKPDSATERETGLRNVHIKRPDGSIHRLQVLPAEDAGAGRIRLFSVDAEGFPEPEELPSELKNVGAEKALDIFEHTGVVIFNESEETLRWGAGRSARVTWRDGNVVEVEIYFATRALLCRADFEGGKFTTLKCLCKVD